jgi:hypothetical protein
MIPVIRKASPAVRKMEPMTASPEVRIIETRPLMSISVPIIMRNIFLCLISVTSFVIYF